MPLPVGGGSAAFGISGRSFADWMNPGVRGEPTVIQFVGKNSPHPGIPWYPNDSEQFWSRGRLCLAGSVVRRRQDHRARRISGHVSDRRRIQFHRAGNQRAGQRRQRDLYRRQQRQCLSRSDEAAVVDSGTRFQQADAADSHDGAKPGYLCSGSESGDALRCRTSRCRSREASDRTCRWTCATSARWAGNSAALRTTSMCRISCATD